ncbi:hypothetical protein COO60DRAFT_1702471 [Scenedesmus sp. NREL 46B-D3]|nr:hypothetical protein COO60DRAFT_1702471 [Scenedesmus sp. NREL 46B-D3]
MSVKELKDFLKQAQVNERDMVGVVEKSDLLRLAKARTQLWEWRRLNLCGSFMANSGGASGEVSLLQLQAAMAVFRVDCPAGADATRSVRDAKDSLKRTYNKLALLVHPDKANQNGHEAYRSVSEEAFKVLNSANDLLTRVASGEAIPGLTQQQQQGAAATGAAAAAAAAAGGAGGPAGGGFAGGFTGGFPGAAAGGAAGTGGARYYYAYVPPGFNPAYTSYAGQWAPRR